LSLNSECCLWYDGKRGSHFRIESNRDVRFEFESNLEALQVPSITPDGMQQKQRGLLSTCMSSVPLCRRGREE